MDDPLPGNPRLPYGMLPGDEEGGPPEGLVPCDDCDVDELIAEDKVIDEVEAEDV